MVSVIVPVYKVEPFLRRCVDSILTQTYQNLEIILVDDGSPDNCGKICDEYAAQDPRVKVIHRENGGLSAARNTGMENASGEYLAFIDSDDWIEPWSMEIMRKLAAEHDADIAEAALRYYRPWKPERLYYEGKNTKKVTVYTNEQALKQLYFGPELLNNLSISACTKLYRAQFLKEKNLRFAEGYLHEDVEFTPRVLFFANKIVTYDDSFYNYNIHLGQDSISGQRFSIRKTASLLEVKRRIFAFFCEHPIDQVSEYAQVGYADAMMHAYYVGRDHGTPEGKQLWKPIPKLYRKHYRFLKGNPCTGSKRYLAFYLSPALFYAVKRGYKAVQKWRKR